MEGRPMWRTPAALARASPEARALHHDNNTPRPMKLEVRMATETSNLSKPPISLYKSGIADCPTFVPPMCRIRLFKCFFCLGAGAWRRLEVLIMLPACRPCCAI